jgi:hypothetical protein
MGYRVLNFDLTQLRDREVIAITRNNKVNAVQILSIPNGAAVQLHIGDGKDGIPLSATVVEYDICPGESTGIFLTNAVQGGTLTLRVDMGDEGQVQATS